MREPSTTNTWARRNLNVRSNIIIKYQRLNLSVLAGCCIYKKPVAFGESSSEDDEDCENCFGHPEKRRRNRKGEVDNDNNEPCEHDHQTGIGD